MLNYKQSLYIISSKHINLKNNLKKVEITMNLLTQLHECKQPLELHTFLNGWIDPKIGLFFGGRRFVRTGEIGSISLNDIVKQFKAIHQNAPKDIETLKIEKEIHRTIYTLDCCANEYLSTKSYFIFLATAIKSFVGNLFFNRNKILYSIKRDIESAEIDIQAAIAEEKRRFFSLSFNEILDMIHDSNTNENQKTNLKKHLNEKLYHVSGDGLEEIRKAFVLLKGDQEKFIDLTMYVASSCSKVLMIDLCELFESLHWPTEDLKSQMLPKILKDSILSYSRNDSIRSSTKVVEGSLTIKIIFDPRKIFGCRNFTTNPIETPPCLAKALALTSISVGKKIFRRLKKKSSEANFSLPPTLKVEVASFHECAVPLSMVNPMRPYLSNSPFSIRLV